MNGFQRVLHAQHEIIKICIHGVSDVNKINNSPHHLYRISIIISQINQEYFSTLKMNWCKCCTSFGTSSLFSVKKRAAYGKYAHVDWHWKRCIHFPIFLLWTARTVLHIYSYLLHNCECCILSTWHWITCRYKMRNASQYDEVYMRCKQLQYNQDIPDSVNQTLAWMTGRLVFHN